MAQLGGVFDATTVEPATGSRTLIPAGNYPAHILRADILPTKDNTGKFIWLEIEIIDSEFKGVTIETRLNVINANPKAVEIAQRELSAICHSIGEMALSDTDQLLFKPFLMGVKIKPAAGEYGPQSEVASYKKLVAGAATGPTPQATKPAAFGAPPARPAAPPVNQASSPATNGAAKPGAPWATPRA